VPTTCQWNLVYGGFTNYSHSVGFGYDENGNVTWQDDWAASYGTAFDKLNRATLHAVTNEATGPSWLSYAMAYDLAGKRTNLLVVTPGNAITTASGFDGLDRLSNVVCSTLGKSMSGTYTYNENGKVASMYAGAGGPGSSLTYSYDSENRLSAISGKCGPPTVLFLAYAYNSAQQITNIAERLSDSRGERGQD